MAVQMKRRLSSARRLRAGETTVFLTDITTNSWLLLLSDWLALVLAVADWLVLVLTVSDWLGTECVSSLLPQCVSVLSDERLCQSGRLQDEGRSP